LKGRCIAADSADYEDQLISRTEFYERKLGLEEEIMGLESQLADRLLQMPNPARIRESFEVLKARFGDVLVNEWTKPENVKMVKATLRTARLRIEVKHKEAHISFS